MPDHWSVSSITVPAKFSSQRASKFQLPAKMANDETLKGNQFLQNVFIMRHGDRIDNFEPLWMANSPRPWDPPLTDAGKIRAWSTGKKLRKEGFQIHRVFVSPFLRCIQTASEVVSALCANQEHLAEISSDNAVIDPSKITVSIEYGLCEVLNREAIRIEIAPKDGDWVLGNSELEAMLPARTVDRSAQPVYLQLPKWEEEVDEARNRYAKVIRVLSDKYPRENLLLITHGEGVGVAVSAFTKEIVYDVDYCGYSHSQRLVTHDPSAGQGFTAEDFKVLTRTGQTGLQFMSKDEFPLLDPWSS